MKNATKPNAFIVISFTINGAENVGQFATESDARKATQNLSHWMISAQLQSNPTLGAKGGQSTLWSERNF